MGEAVRAPTRDAPTALVAAPRACRGRGPATKRGRDNSLNTPAPGKPKYRCIDHTAKEADYRQHRRPDINERPRRKTTGHGVVAPFYEYTNERPGGRPGQDHPDGTADASQPSRHDYLLMHWGAQREAATDECAPRAAGWRLAAAGQVCIRAGDEVVGAGQGADALDNMGGIADHDRLRRHVPRDHRASADDCVAPNRDRR